jgi:small subunit ribosomal protein S8e
MSTHSSLRKRKLSGGKKRAYRSKKKYEAGGFPAETVLGEPRRKSTRGLGGNIRVKVLSEKFASVTDPKSGKTEKTGIVRVARNGANVDYNRRGVITKGAEIETGLGLAKVTSRPGADGIINAILITKESIKK